MGGHLGKVWEDASVFFLRRLAEAQYVTIMVQQPHNPGTPSIYWDLTYINRSYLGYLEAQDKDTFCLRTTSLK